MKFSRLATPSFFILVLAGISFAQTFESASFIPTGVQPDAIAVGDFNHDGKLDIVVANSNDSSVQVFLGDGTGRFKLRTTVALDGPPVAIAVGDFNGDGKIDVAAVTNDLFILLGNGNGTFRVGGMFPVDLHPNSIAVADFNHDGRLDVAVGFAVNGGGVDVLLGKGNGTFQSAVAYLAGDGPTSIATGDINNDGKIDLIVSDLSLNTGLPSVNVLLGRGDGTFRSPIETGNLTSGGGTVAVGDFNGDGKLDVAVGCGAFQTVLLPLVLLFGD